MPAPADTGKAADSESDRTTIRVARKADLGAISELCQRRGLTAMEPETWVSLWQDNPALRDVPGDIPPGWVAERSGRIIGYMGNVVLRYSLGGETFRAVAGHKYVTDARTFPLAIALLRVFADQPGADFVVITAANKASNTLTRRIFDSGYLPQFFRGTSYFWLLRRPARAWAVQFRRRHRKVPPVLAVLTGCAVAWPMFAAGRLASAIALPQAAGGRADCITIDAVGDAFDDLWRRLARDSNKLLSFRDAKTLRWHFGTPKNRDKVSFVTWESDGLLRGYAVLRRNETQDGKMRRRTIVDIVTERDDPDFVRRLFAECIEVARAAGDDMLEAPYLPPDLDGVMRRLMALRRPRARLYPGYILFDGQRTEALTDPAVWRLGPYDGDYTL